jgi:phage protein D
MPDINNARPGPIARRPRGAVKLNGAAVPGWIDIEVENNAFRAADTFRVTYSIGQLVAPYTLDWFSTQSSLSCEIFMNEDPADPASYTPSAADSQILGQVDDIDIDLVARTIMLAGRDYTAKLIDTKTSTGYLNKTSSEIATILAGQAGLSPVVTATSTQVGTFYKDNRADLQQERSYWDILCELARYENFDVFVKGNELHFQAKPKDSGDRYALVWDATGTVPTANVTDLRLQRSLTIAQGVAVTVKSWHGKMKKSLSASWPRTPAKTKPGQSGATTPLAYTFTIAGLTQDQAQQEAQRRYDEITRHMVKLSAEMPGDGLLDCTKIVQLRGTGSNWDQDYFPDEVHRYMSVTEGYRMTVSAKNISQEYAADT